MFCSKCGKEIPDNSAFCSACGAQLGTVAPGAPAQPATKEGWMLAAVRETIEAGLKDPDSVKYGTFENIEIDAYGRTYAEMVVRAKNSYGAYVPTRYGFGFFDVTDSAPCALIPKAIFVLPGVMVGAQRKIAKKMIKFGSPR